MPTRSMASAQRGAPRQVGAQVGVAVGAEHVGAGQIEPAVGPDGSQLLVGAAVEAASCSARHASHARRCGSRAERPPAGRSASGPRPAAADSCLGSKSGHGFVVESPVGAGQLGIAVGREPHGQAGKRRVPGVARGQLAQHAEHRLLHARMEHVVVRRQSPPRRPRSAAGRARPRRSTAMPFGLGPAGPADGLQFRQRRGKLDHRDQSQVLAVEQPQQHLQRVLADGVLAGGEEYAAVVARRRLQQRAGIDRAAVGRHADHQPVVAHVVEIIDQPRAGFVERPPVVEAAAAPRVQAFGRGESLGDQGAVEIGRQQAAVGGRPRGPPPAAARRPRRCAASPHTRRRVLPAVGQQHQRGWCGARRSAGAAASADRRRTDSAALSIPEPMVIGVIAPAALGSTIAIAQRLRYVAGIVDFQQVRPAGLADGQPKGLPTDVRGVGVGPQLGQIRPAVPPRSQAVVAQRALSTAGAGGPWPTATPTAGRTFRTIAGWPDRSPPLRSTPRPRPGGPAAAAFASTTICTRRSAIVRFQLNGCRTACDQLRCSRPRSTS